MAESFPCIVYYRSRDHEPVANAQALEQQLEAEQAACAQGYYVRERFGDFEASGPYESWLEPRPGWQQACEAANAIAVAEGRCSLIVLRSAPIGTSDMFLPTREGLHADVQGRMAELPMRSYAINSTFRSAHGFFGEHKRMIASLERDEIAPSPLPESELVFRPNAERRAVSAFYGNPSVEVLTLEWQIWTRVLLRSDPWSEAQPWTLLTVPAGECQYLATSFQDDGPARFTRWRFRVGAGRARRIGSTILLPQEFVGGPRALRWLAYEPTISL